ncbi:MAG: DNA/RNA non-specific endonuclease [Paracoccaceae bacterium]|nr:DNA/RNA non-specific endonuclease [Paracoccaceae bacterium]
MSNAALDEIVLRRIRESQTDIEHALRKIDNHNPYAAEQNIERRTRRLQRKLNIAPREAEALSAAVQQRAVDVSAEEAVQFETHSARGGPEAIWGDTIDFVAVAFLEKGAAIARSVGRVAFLNGTGQGTGVLIGENLFLTNNHVIGGSEQTDQFVLEFDYERDLNGALRSQTRFLIDGTFFITDPVNGLDFSLFSVGQKLSGPGSLAEFGRTVLSDASDKHMVGEFANIVQHPRGRFKEVVLRENRLVNRFDDALHYVADTEPGSSGSPVYNSEWQMIALHHWGGPWIDQAPGASFEINEGIRTSSIVRKLKDRMPSLPATQRERLLRALALPEMAPARAAAADEGGKQVESGVHVAEDGTATWTLPVELSVRIPALAKDKVTETAVVQPSIPAAAEAEDDFSDRSGYLPDFLPGFHIPLPALGPAIRDDAARLIDPEPGANPFELKYHHFSVVLNARRRLAFFTACMIDGATAKSINRKTGAVSLLSPFDPGLEESLDDAEGDSWRTDPRVERDTYSGGEVYKGQVVPGFPSPQSSGRIARMFQRGHLVRRIDPAWGSDARALAAERDTFHWTNAAPQVGFFNQGTADEDDPGTGNGNLWRAAENYVLRNAVAEDQRVVSFTGPVFRNNDRPFRHIKIPQDFFKVTVWVENGTLQALALLVNQSQVFDAWPEALGTPEFLASAEAAEAFLDDDELDRVTDFLSTVQEIEDLTGINFGDDVRAADVREGQGTVPVSDDNLPIDGGSGIAVPGALDAPDGAPDDLKRISGIGPALQRLLNDNGIFHFHQIAAWGPAEIAVVDTLLQFSGRIERDDWVAQAQDLMA